MGVVMLSVNMKNVVAPSLLFKPFRTLTRRFNYDLTFSIPVQLYKQFTVVNYEFASVNNKFVVINYKIKVVSLTLRSSILRLLNYGFYFVYL
jgi:hypothetical protein